MANTNNNDEKRIDDDSLDLPDDLLYELALSMNDNDANIPQKRNEEEQCLSQKLSQLLTSEDRQSKQSKDSTTNKRSSSSSIAITTPSNVSKKIKIDDETTVDDEVGKDKIPNYLSMNDQDFQKLIESLLSTMANSMTGKDLQEIALLLRHIATIDLEESLWNSYLQSGTGELEKEHGLSTIRHLHPLFLWPKEMKKSMMIKENKHNHEMIEINIDQIDHQTCLNYARNILRQFTERKLQYQTQLNEKKYSFKNSFNPKMEDTLRQFIEQRELLFIRLQFQSKISIVNYDYRDRLVELEYHQLKPNQYQLHLFEKLTQVKLEKEKSKYEVEMLKQRLQHHCLPAPLNSLQLPLPLPPLSLDTIIDSKMRQELLARHRRIFKRTEADMMALYIAIAKAKLDECQLQFDQIVAQMRPNQRSATTDQRLSQLMIKIVEERFRNIDERLQYLYSLKIRFLEEQTNKRAISSTH